MHCTEATYRNGLGRPYGLHCNVFANEKKQWQSKFPQDAETTGEEQPATKTELMPEQGIDT